MRVAYFDCIGGASGDMLLGALADAGVAQPVLQSVIPALNLSDCELTFQRVMRGALAALGAQVTTPERPKHRRLNELLEVVRTSSLPSEIQEQATSILRRLGEIEAGVHDMPLEEVHLHELGGDDTLIDVCGVLVGLHELGLERVYVSPLPLGRGFVQSEHGMLPLPAPATLELLKDVPVRYVEIEKELVTPTGAALLTSLAVEYGGFPAMRLERVGLGAGGRELPFPNVVRLWVGESQAAPEGLLLENLVVLETNIDDMNPQRYEAVMERLFAAGAMDVTLAPIQMKKNRPATLLSVLSRPENASIALEIILNETTTLGVRRYPVERVSLPRSFQTVQTAYGPIRLKLVEWGSVRRASPEYDDCKQAAHEHGVPIEQVMGAALGAYREGSS
jgi:uncharacterized protein (TIGR00299 family) protein